MEYVKICGLKNEVDIKLCSDYGAKAVGFIYNVPESPRNLNIAELLELLKTVPEKILTVIVFKPKNISEIENIVEEIQVNYYQIHINFGLEDLKDLSSDLRRKLIISLKVDQSNKNDIIKLVNKFHDLFFAFLLDNSEGQGKKFNFDLVKDILSKIIDTKIILAGGIQSENLKSIALWLNPFGIDACSSLESAKGVKDPNKIKKFLNEINKLKELEYER